MADKPKKKRKTPNQITATKGREARLERMLQSWLTNGRVQHKASLEEYPHTKKWKRPSQDAYASKLFAEPYVQNRIIELQADAQRQTGLTAEYIIATLKENIDRSMAYTPVMESDGVTPKLITLPDGRTIAAVFEYNGATANAAINLAMKHKGLFEADNKQKGSILGLLDKLPKGVLETLSRELRMRVVN